MTQVQSSVGPLSDAERYFFDIYGYLVRYGALSDAEVVELNSAIDRLPLGAPGPELHQQRFDGFFQHEQVFRDLIDHPAVLAPLAQLCGRSVRLDHAYGIYMAPGTSGLGLHGGGTPHDPSQFYDVHNGHMFNGLVAVQWALVDQGVGQGGFCCIPGSHRANFAAPQPIPKDWVVTIPVNAGDAVIFTEGLTHGTAPWHGTAERRCLLYKYSPGHSAWSAQHTTTLSELAARNDLTDQQRRMLQPPNVGSREHTV